MGVACLERAIATGSNKPEESESREEKGCGYEIVNMVRLHADGDGVSASLAPKLMELLAIVRTGWLFTALLGPCKLHCM